MKGRIGAARIRNHVIIPTPSHNVQYIIQHASVWESKLFAASLTLNISLLIAFVYFILRAR